MEIQYTDCFTYMRYLIHLFVRNLSTVVYFIQILWAESRFSVTILIVVYSVQRYSVVVSAYHFESGRPGSSHEWGQYIL